MARAPILSAPSLNPFGGGSGGFGAFSLGGAAAENTAYLEFLKVKIRWDNGEIGNAEYLAAYEIYVGKLKDGSTNQLNAQQSLNETKYRLERNGIVAKVEAGTSSYSDLLAFDRSHLEGLNHDSQQYLDRLDLYQSTQSHIFSEQAQAQHDLYQAGKMTAAQLRSWYMSAAGSGDFAGNKAIQDQIHEQLTALDQRIVSEKDQAVVADYQAGKLGLDAFIAYAATARARYAQGTDQEQQWTKLITQARDQVAEKQLTYRYGLSQDYVQLQKYISDNEALIARATTGSTSESTRIVLGADGQWKTVTSTTTQPYKPSAAEVAAMAQRRIELADAKNQLASLTNQISASGGFVPTQSMIDFYTGQQASLAKGSVEWYSVQGRIDSLIQQQHQELVLSQEGVNVNFGGGTPPTSSSSGGGLIAGGTSGGANVSIDQFMAAIASVESGGRYDAVNSSSGASGKYQIMPANWPSWAGKYLGNAAAPMTPENQEAVARGKMLDLYAWLGSWEKVAHWWLTGSNTEPGQWSASSTSYVNKVMGNLGLAPIAGAGATSGPYQTGTGTPTATVSPTGGSGPLEIITGQKPPVAIMPGVLVPAQYTTARTGFPANLDGAAFTKFYDGFVTAFKDGATTWVDRSSGQPVTYSIPGDLVARATMMAQLDQLRIGYYQTRAMVYAGTPSEIVASDQAAKAIKDAADNAYTILVTAMPGNQIVTLGGGQPIIDPIAQGLAVLEQTKAYVAQQQQLAAEAYARGDLTGAWAHTQLAQATVAATKIKMEGAYLPLAERAMQQIFGDPNIGGSAAPDSVTKALGQLTDWQGALDPALKKLDQTAGDIRQWAKLSANGYPAIGADGTIALHDGAGLVLGPDGTVKPVDLASAGYGPDGKPLIDAGQLVRVRVNLGGTSPVQEVYAKWEVGIVGYTDGGMPVMGKVIAGYLNDQRYTLVEDPFSPGHWSQGMLRIAAPPGFSAVAGTSPGDAVYQIKGNGGEMYRLQLNPKTGSYSLIKAGFLGGEPVTLTDADAQKVLKGLGFGLDLSQVPLEDRWKYDQIGGFIGFSKTEFQTYTTLPQAPIVPYAPPSQFAKGQLVGGTLIQPQYQGTAVGGNVFYIPKPPPPVPPPDSATRDTWYRDQIAAPPAIPIMPGVTVKPYAPTLVGGTLIQPLPVVSQPPPTPAPAPYVAPTPIQQAAIIGGSAPAPAPAPVAPKTTTALVGGTVITAPAPLPIVKPPTTTTRTSNITAI